MDLLEKQYENPPQITGFIQKGNKSNIQNQASRQIILQRTV